MSEPIIIGNDFQDDQILTAEDMNKIKDNINALIELLTWKQ
jgi:hypothetical protein